MRMFSAAAMVVMALSTPAQAGIETTPHNLSVTGLYEIRSTTETQICIFCHTPHNARRDIPYLWNREDSTINYTTYESSTLFATVGQPTGASKLCLSCHDGTIALGAILSAPNEIPFVGGIRFLTEDRNSYLGTDLSDDHPVSFVYSESVAASNGELVSPSTLVGDVRLDDKGMLQCTACHDPHDDPLQNQFLVLTNQGSVLCLACHDRRGWLSSVHANTNKTWNGALPDPWPHTEWTTVADNACENCHRPHTAGGHARLLNYAIEEDNCLVCHNGNVSQKNIADQLLKRYRHRVDLYLGVHDPAEDFTTASVTDHVECADCHNPHQVQEGGGGTAPNLPGPLLGVDGIDTNGNLVVEVSYEYEICYKCHGGANNVARSLISEPIARHDPELDTMVEFDPSAVSYHPVEAAAHADTPSPSLTGRYAQGSLLSCSDCHNNNDLGVPRGPHGSDYEYLLAAEYNTLDPVSYDRSQYQLCFECHSEQSLMQEPNPPSGFPHRLHVVDENGACSTCHDPHGIQSLSPAPGDHTHLINFDLRVVLPNSQGNLAFRDDGAYAGACSLNCHNVEHIDTSYP